MADVTLSDIDLFGKRIPWAGSAVNGFEVSLNMGAGTYTADAERTSNDMILKMPGLLLATFKLASGAATLKIDKHSGTPAFGSPDLTFNLSGTNYAALQTLAIASGDQISVNVVAGGAGCVIAEVVLVLVQFKSQYVDFRLLSAGMNAVSQTASAPSFAIAA